MEAPCLSIKGGEEPPKLLRKPLPPKILPALDAKKPTTFKHKECIPILPAPTPFGSRTNSAEEHVHWNKSRVHQEHSYSPLYLAQDEEQRSSGPADFPSKKSHWKSLIRVHPHSNDDPRFEPPPPEFTLNDLIARSYHYSTDLTDTLHKTTLSRQHYSNIELFIASLQNRKQNKVHNVVLPVSNLPEKSKRIPWQQQILERQQEMLRMGGTRSLEYTGKEKASHNNSQTMDSDSEHDNKVLITHCNLAILECMVHGGHALSLKAYFISKLPDLTPLYGTLLYLNLSFNELRCFPREVYNLENLEVLKLRNNPIQEIPSGIQNLKKLRTFIISFCLLSSLPIGLFVLPYIQVLDVSYNSISSIPNDICNLRVLEFLNIEGNKLPALPCGALKLQLKYLRVGNNAMHPLFWRENTHIEPQRLADLAALTFSKNGTEKYSAVIPEEVKQTLQNFKVCDCCRGPLYGQGLCFIRPCEKIFGIRKLPFMFRSCSVSCYETFMHQTESLDEHLYES
ncbi:leucine-rich repeat-containing 63 isoform X1 [Pelobates cultripes]|uniref:Leucine-rich repeat-containing 63 isoform X1 n=1 Tax=Pelobates cultripes TaxID=61616 RepID=A0AAD1VLH5_PELCU|nr:leucine-rich repeat-containing 63 isoform X1 [Pelobates cultripes]